MNIEDKIIPAINLHLTKSCNMKCKYCFAKFNETKKTYPYQETLELIRVLRDFGFEKINFVGGEPMLIPKISKIIKYAKRIGFYTSIVSNGTLITNEFLFEIKNHIDMIGISIDSLNSETNKKIGRFTHKRIMSIKDYTLLVEAIELHNIDLKINTVVSKNNKNENFSNFINNANPLRWKIFQVLKIEGENDTTFNEHKISETEFKNFCRKNKKHLLNPEILIPEKTEIIKGSYLMINPEGHFFDNTKGSYTISDKITIIGVAKALNQIKFNYDKFELRKGNYFKQQKTQTNVF